MAFLEPECLIYLMNRVDHLGGFDGVIFADSRCLTIATLPSPFILRCGLDIIRVSVLNLYKRATT